MKVRTTEKNKERKTEMERQKWERERDHAREREKKKTKVIFQQINLSIINLEWCVFIMPSCSGAALSDARDWMTFSLSWGFQEKTGGNKATHMESSWFFKHRFPHTLTRFANTHESEADPERWLQWLRLTSLNHSLCFSRDAFAYFYTEVPIFMV